MANAPPRKWYYWYSPTDTPAERKLILKLDILLVGYAFIMLWVKYIDQTNISKPPLLPRQKVNLNFQVPDANR
jgi:hypothetical protein